MQPNPAVFISSFLTLNFIPLVLWYFGLEGRGDAND